MRCPDCNKFVGQEAGEPEVNNIEISDGEVRVEVRVPITCAECSSELKEGNFEMEDGLPDDIIATHQGEGYELEIEEDGTDVIDEYQTTDRKGKPIKNPRYQTHLYGAVVNFSVRCSCQEKGAEPLFSGALEDKMPASNFDELV